MVLKSKQANKPTKQKPHSLLRARFSKTEPQNFLEAFPSLILKEYVNQSPLGAIVYQSAYLKTCTHLTIQ